jgi:uncharacterized protein (TIGR02246 family)
VSDVVDRVLAALNAKDVEAFVACYAEDGTIEDGYDNVRARGHDAIRTLYAAMFERFPELRVEAGRRTGAGAFVVQEETVTGRSGHEQHVAVYQLADDVIVRERLFA